jgi:hypothetical protein
MAGVPSACPVDQDPATQWRTQEKILCEVGIGLDQKKDLTPLDAYFFFIILNYTYNFLKGLEIGPTGPAD